MSARSVLCLLPSSWPEGCCSLSVRSSPSPTAIVAPASAISPTGQRPRIRISEDHVRCRTCRPAPGFEPSRTNELQAPRKPPCTCRGRWQSASWGNRRVSPAGRSAWRRHAPRGALSRRSVRAYRTVRRQSPASVSERPIGLARRLSASADDSRAMRTEQERRPRGHLTARGPAQGDPHTGPQVRARGG